MRSKKTPAPKKDMLISIHDIMGTRDPFDPPDQSPEDPEYRDLFSLFENLRPHILDSLPYRHPVRRALEKCWDHEDRDERPNRKPLQKVVDAIFALPNRQQVLNGWNCERPDLVSNRYLTNWQLENIQVRSVAYFTAYPKEVRTERVGYLQGHADESNAPVGIYIAIGTRKMDAVDALLNFARDLEIDWEEIMGRIEADDLRK